jgi:uncharacterized tellurite resistance protein B-like protein
LRNNRLLLLNCAGIRRKKLPDEKVLEELLVLAKNFEQQALSLYEQARKITRKWRIRLDSRRKAAIEKSDKSPV